MASFERKEYRDFPLIVTMGLRATFLVRLLIGIQTKFPELWDAKIKKKYTLKKINHTQNSIYVVRLIEIPKAVRLEYPKFMGKKPLGWVYKAHQFF